MKKVRLAGAVRADDAAQLAVLDGEVDVAVGDQAAVALGQAARLQDRARRRGRVARWRGGDRRDRAAGRDRRGAGARRGFAASAWPPRDRQLRRDPRCRR